MQFEAEMYFTEPGDEITGKVEELLPYVKDTNGQPTPRLSIRTTAGIRRTVTAYEARLKAALLDIVPPIKKGETIFIRYLGDDKRSAPGMSPAKLFKVKVDRPTAPGPEPQP